VAMSVTELKKFSLFLLGTLINQVNPRSLFIASIPALFALEDLGTLVLVLFL
jgi:hypothetical protein